MAEPTQHTQTMGVRVALALYRARHRYIDDAIAEYGRNCPNPPPIEEIQKTVAKYVKRNLSDIVSEMREDK